ncbi:cell division protein ZapE [Pinisolibacter sp.]|uniref:cell division protein ZapE n=1 Tax=Pinisolibacter sp. TaxID=2172024 RepID=UPI002FDD8744
MSQSEDESRTVVGRYQALVDTRAIAYDPLQAELARRLDDLDRALAQSDLAAKGSALGWLFGRRAPKRETLRGLYVHGAVGRGKTMLMDLFFECSTVARKRRAHFHAFMADTQDRIHRARRAILDGRRQGNDPIAPVAEEIAAETRLLCFDEFAVYDIADAMILGRLFQKLFELGVVVVATSNVAPQRLYWGGLNRALFLPFVDLLGRHTDVFELLSPNDYRLTKTEGDEVWRMPLGAVTDAAMEEEWFRLTGHRPTPPEAIPFRGRAIDIPAAAAGHARFHFRDLCDKPLSAADFVQIARRYHTVMIEGVPVLGPDRRNAVKRLINLVDALYDCRVKIVVSAAAEPAALWTDTDGTESFEFARTVSRLTEMRSHEYARTLHGTGDGALAHDEPDTSEEDPDDAVRQASDT